MGMRVLLTKPVVAAIAVIVLAGSGAGIAFSLYHASAPTSFVIATDRGNNQIDRIDLSTRSVTVLLSNKVLPGTPDSIVFMSDTKMLIDFLNNGEIGIGDIQQGTYQSLGAGHGGALRDMALRPDGSGVLISDANGNILEYHVDSQNFTTFVQNLGGVQGLAFDSNGALYAAVGGQVIQLDPTSGKQLKTFNLPGGSDGLAYDGHHHTLDIAVGSSIVALDPQTGKTAILTDGITTPDGLAIDRQGNLFIADVIGVLELNTNNQLLIVGTNTAGINWDDVAPLSGAGAASY
jgi:WD40 repeat protein